MAIYSYHELQKRLENYKNETELYKLICKNIKKYRKLRYNEFKRNSLTNSINPYTTENFAALLDYNHTHYKRFESENDSTKRIPLIKLLMASIILDIDLEDLFNENIS